MEQFAHLIMKYFYIKTNVIKREKQIEFLTDDYKLIEDKKTFKNLKLAINKMSTKDSITISELLVLGYYKECKEIISTILDNNIKLNILNPTIDVDQDILKLIEYLERKNKENIRAVRLDGLYKAKEKKRLGRPRAEYPPMWEMYYIQYKEKRINYEEVMNALDLKKTTFYKLLKEYEEEIKNEGATRQDNRYTSNKRFEE